MNINLIKKYKKEFDHWLDGGKLLYRNSPDNGIDSTWHNADTNKDIFTDKYRIEIVIDDEYVEFRKALVEG